MRERYTRIGIALAVIGQTKEEGIQQGWPVPEKSEGGGKGYRASSRFGPSSTKDPPVFSKL